MTNTFPFKAHIQPLRAQKPKVWPGETFTNRIISMSRKVISLLPPCKQIVNSQTSSHSPKSVWEIRMSPLRRVKQMRRHFLKIAVKPASISCKTQKPWDPRDAGSGTLNGAQRSENTLNDTFMMDTWHHVSQSKSQNTAHQGWTLL